MGCLLALLGAMAPRLALLLLWIFTPIVNVAFQPWIMPWLWPILGIVFLPFTTLMYVLVASGGALTIWGWLIVLLGLLIDLGAYGQSYEYREQIPGMATSK